MAYRHINYNELQFIPCPEWTETWHPMSHHQVIVSLGKALVNEGIGIRDYDIVVSEDGKKMFSTYTLDVNLNGEGYVQIGVRQATDKSFALGAVAGIHVICCENLCFSGGYINFKRHTKGMDEDSLQKFLKEALKTALSRSTDQWEWQKALRKWYVSPDQFKILTYDLIDKGVMPASKLKRYQLEVAEETRLNFNYRTLYQIHGGVTRMYRSRSMVHRLPGITERLNAACDDYVNEYKLAA